MSAAAFPPPSRLANKLYVAATLVVRAAHRLAPRRLRAPWRREWDAELWHARRLRLERGEWSVAAALALVLRSLGSIPHALSLRARPRSPQMLLQDIRFALRALVRSPGFTAVTVLTLALGIGANTAIFSILDAVVLQPLPFPDSDRLVNLYSDDLTTPTRGPGNESYLDFADFREQTTSFAELAAWTFEQPRITGNQAAPQRLLVAVVDHRLMETLGIRPLLGRDFDEEDDRLDSTPTVILSYGFWQSRFAGDPRILGQDILLDDAPHTVIGILPPDYGGGAITGSSLPPSAAHAWVPLVPTMQDTTEVRGVHIFILVGRLVDGVSLERAQEDVATVAARLESTYPGSNKDLGAWLQPVQTALVGDYRPLLLVLTGAVGLVLLIACANVANLMLSRATARQQEIAVRMALGAGSRRIVRQLLTESCVLASGGAALGLILARVGTATLVALAPVSIPRIDTLGVDGRVLAFTLAATVLTGLLFGLAPALRSARTDLQLSLKAGGRGSADAGTHRLRQGLVVAEVTLTVLLVIGAGLLLRTFWRKQQAPPGFDPHGVLAVDIQMPMGFVAPQWPQAVAFFRDVTERIGTLPGVDAASAAFAHPVNPGFATSFGIDGRPPAEPGSEPEANFRPVLPGYFDTMRIPMLAGREFDDGDDSGAPGVVIINRAFAEDLFPDENPIGQRLLKNWWWGDAREGVWEIVGVAENVPFLGAGTGPQWAMYFPQAQVPVSFMTLLVRTDGPPLEHADAVRRAIWEVDPAMPLDSVRTMDAILHDRIASPRFNLALLGTFAAVALALAAIGIYGVLAYSVTQRARELGIRLALGAASGRVVALVVVGGVRLTAIGTVLGIAGAFFLSSLLDRFIEGVDRHDPLTFTAVAAFLLGVSVLASLVPAWRASRLDPVDTLKRE